MTWPEGPQESSPGCNPGLRMRTREPPQRLGGLKGRGNPTQGFILRKAPLSRYADETGSEDQAILMNHWAFPAPIQGATGSMCLVPRVSPWAGYLRPSGPAGCRANSKTVEIAVTDRGNRTCDILPTLRVGTRVWDALRPNDPEARHRPKRRGASKTAFPRGEPVIFWACTLIFPSVHDIISRIELALSRPGRPRIAGRAP